MALGDLARSNGNLAGALEWYDKAIARLGGALGDGALRDAHAGRAEVLTAQGKFKDAVSAWDSAMRSTSRPIDRCCDCGGRGRSVAAGDVRWAAEEAKDWPPLRKRTPTMLDGSARILALAAAKDANSYAADAVALLRRAHAAGRYRDAGFGGEAADRSRFRGDAGAGRVSQVCQRSGEVISRPDRRAVRGAGRRAPAAGGRTRRRRSGSRRSCLGHGPGLYAGTR